MEEEDGNVCEPLLSTSPAANNDELFLSKSGIIFRLLSVVFIGIIAVWANYEASKGFGITIINDDKESPAGKRFNLLYVSNDKATRIVMNTSSFVENVLYPPKNIVGGGRQYSKKKQVKHVSLRLFANNNRSSSSSYSNMQVTVSKVGTSGGVGNHHHHQFVIHISPSIIMDLEKGKNDGGGGTDHSTIFTSMVLSGMARVWLWEGGETGAPPWLLDGMVEYIIELAGFRNKINELEFGGADDHTGELRNQLDRYCLGNREPKAVAQFLDYCEKHNGGFIQRLNQALEVRWHNRTLEDALGMPVDKLCDSSS